MVDSEAVLDGCDAVDHVCCWISDRTIDDGGDGNGNVETDSFDSWKGDGGGRGSCDNEEEDDMGVDADGIFMLTTSVDKRFGRSMMVEESLSTTAATFSLSPSMLSPNRTVKRRKIE